VLQLAERENGAGRQESARLAFWRASSYFRTAGVMLMGTPLDQRLMESNLRQTEAFRRGAALLPHPPEQLEIPYEGTTLPGYLFRVDDDPTPRPLVILLGGYDSTAEELYFANGAAALARGYHVLAFDGPGQGSALVQRGLVLRPDYERVVTPVLDFALARPGIDGDRVALVGLSLGAHLAPRAVSREHRIAACIADCGAFDMFDSALARMPGPLATGFAEGRVRSVAVVRAILTRLAPRPTAGWALRRGQLVHGVADPLAYLNELRQYSLKGYAEQITCPTFVCNAEGDEISASAPQLFTALRCPKMLVTFTTADGAGDHCESGARTLYHARSFGWLDGILQPAHPRSTFTGVRR
jgi:alpha-beta hydrolase superfamily lysophospholipase